MSVAAEGRKLSGQLRWRADRFEGERVSSHNSTLLTLRHKGWFRERLQKLENLVGKIHPPDVFRIADLPAPPFFFMTAQNTGTRRYLVTGPETIGRFKLRKGNTDAF